MLYKRKQTTKGRRKAPAMTKALKRYVDVKIARSDETKCQSFSARTTLSSYVGTSLTTLNFNDVLSLIIQGVGEGNRIGNKIKVISATIRGWVAATVATAGNPLVVKMFVGRLRTAISTPNSGQFVRLYENGNSTLPPSNDYFDILRIVNRDVFSIVKTKIFKVGLASGLSSTNFNNDFNMMCPFSINVSKHFNNLIFDDALTTPTNQALYCWFVCVNADGTATSVTLPPMINLCYDMEIKYKDN